MVVLSIVAGVCPITRHARGVFAAPFQGSQPNASTFRVAMTVETAGRILVTTQPSFAEAINWIRRRRQWFGTRLMNSATRYSAAASSLNLAASDHHVTGCERPAARFLIGGRTAPI